MSKPAQPQLSFHKRSFFELALPNRTLFIDPVFSHERRGRRVADDVRQCDYLLATSMTPWFDDVLDVLADGSATFISTPRLRRYVSSELEIKSGRLLDLEPWERASEEGLRMTALPITASVGMESAINEGASIMRDLGKVMPATKQARVPLFNDLVSVFDSGMRSTARLAGSFGSASRPRSLDRVTDMLGVDVGGITGGRPGLGYLFEVASYGTLMHLADGVHVGTPDEDLEDMADVCEPDVLVMQAYGVAVEPVVRAARILKPKTVLLYRARDPYRAGRRGQTVPMGSFVQAIEEGAPDSTPIHMRKGDSFMLERRGATAAAAKPVATSLGSKAPASAARKA